MQPKCDPRTPYFIIHVPPPVLRCESSYCGLHKTRNRITRGAKSEEKKWKSVSKQLRDRKRLENFLERKSLCAAFPFSELYDQELTDTFFDGLVSWVDILCEKLSGAEIRSLKTTTTTTKKKKKKKKKNEELHEGILQQLLDYNEQTKIFKTREQELENERSHLDEKRIALKKKLTKIQYNLCLKKFNHFSLKDAFTEVRIYTNRMKEKKSDLQARVTHLRDNARGAATATFARTIRQTSLSSRLWS